MTDATTTTAELSSSQAQAFAELKQLCERNACYWPTSELEWKSSSCEKGGDDDEDQLDVRVNDDATLLRFLRARSFDPLAAFKQYSATAAWRRKYQLDKSYDEVEMEKFERMRRLQPQWTGRRDKAGIPVMAYVVSEIRPEDLTQVGKEDPELSSIFFPAEYVTRFVQPLCGRLMQQKHNRTIVASVEGSTTMTSGSESNSSTDDSYATPPFDLLAQCFTSTNIIDLSSVGLRSFWGLRSLLQAASKMATAHYPETVEHIFVVGAPSFFPTIWSLITRWFEPATTRKIHILPADKVRSTLTEYIEPADFPRRFGGELDWVFGMHPLLDDETKRFLKGPEGENEGEGEGDGSWVERWIEGPIRYIKSSQSTPAARRRGEVDAEPGQEDTILAVGTTTQSDTNGGTPLPRRDILARPRVIHGPGQANDTTTTSPRASETSSSIKTSPSLLNNDDDDDELDEKKMASLSITEDLGFSSEPPATTTVTV